MPAVGLFIEGLGMVDIDVDGFEVIRLFMLFGVEGLSVRDWKALEVPVCQGCGAVNAVEAAKCVANIVQTIFQLDVLKLSELGVCYSAKKLICIVVERGYLVGDPMVWLGIDRWRYDALEKQRAAAIEHLDALIAANPRHPTSHVAHSPI